VLQATTGLRGLVGLASYGAWNVRFAALAVLYVLHMRLVLREAGREAPAPAAALDA
jgi:hypothetical protein